MKNYINDSDYEILVRIKEGDTSAFRLLVEKYKNISFSLACSILKFEPDAEDALQESFIRAYKSIGNFRFQSTFSTWLYRIVVNTCFTFSERLKKRRALIDIDSRNLTEIGNYDTGIENLIATERIIIINKVLDKLKPNESLILRLYYLSELDMKEIKSVTGFYMSKIKVTLFRGRQNFLLELKKIFGNEIIHAI